MFSKILELLQAKQAADIALFGGGIIPPDDAARSSRRWV